MVNLLVVSKENSEPALQRLAGYGKRLEEFLRNT
jgi:hypothetical protein